MLRIFSRTALAIALLLVALLPTSAIVAQDTAPLLDRLPADYDAAILVPDLAALDTGLAAIESAAGLGLGELQDAMGRFKRELGLMQGLDDTGPLAIVLIEAGEQPIAVMLLPTTDYDALAASLQAEPGDLINVTLPGGDTGVLRKMDGYAILGPNRRVVQAYTPARSADTFAQRVGQHGRRIATQSQLVLVANTNAMDRDTFTAQMSYFANLGLTHADNILAVDLEPTQFMPMMTNLAHLLAKGTDAVVVGIDFGTQGMTYAEAYKLNDDETLNELFPGQGEGTNPTNTLAKLPDDPIVFAIAGDPSSVGSAQWADHMGGFVGLDAGHALGTAKPQLQALFAQADGLATAYYALPNPSAIAERWMNTITVFEVQDAADFAIALEEAVLSLNDAELPVGGGESITFTTTYKPEDRRLGGVRYDTFTFKAHIPESLRTTPMMIAAAALGEIGFTGQAAVIEGHVVVTTFDDFSTITRAIETVEAGNGLGTAGPLRTLRDHHLPSTASLIGALDLQGVADTLGPLLSSVGTGQPITVPPNTQPIGFAIQASDDEALVQLFIPASALLAMLEESFEPHLQENNSDNANDAGRDNGPGLLGPGRQTQPGRPNSPRNPGTRPGRTPGRDPGRAPGLTPGRNPR